MSDTPKSDNAALNYHGPVVSGFGVAIEFARELERENARLRDALRNAREQLNDYGEASAGMGLPDFSRIDAALA